ncbi:odorant receptor 131-2-like [Salarias fasciatus]|uniref:odorant receptor 131-2-like n=1 Tax=Salarias fasciatus TaxID=181472 RepID=UPI0011768123|nr:odorant receptor 131-2-like [Salarias fasciatus]
MNISSHSHNVSYTLQNQQQKSSVTKMVVVFALGLIINYINGTLLHTFRKHQIFYLNPRYILFIHLVINDMIQLTTAISLVILGNIFYRINVVLCCFILTFALCTTFNTPLNLAVMALECYVAVCLPLRHSELCTINRTYILIGCIWAMSTVSVTADIFLAVAAEPKHLMFNNALYCENDNVLRHPVTSQKKVFSFIVFMVAVWFTIFYTYVNIFLAARAAKSTKSTSGHAKKARNTILLHGFQLLLSMLTYVAHLLIKGLISLFPKNFSEIVFVVYVIVHIFPRLVSPIVYGLRDNTFRRYLKRHLLCAERPGINIEMAPKPMLQYSKPRR